jgi:hypothetical protein
MGDDLATADEASSQSQSASVRPTLNTDCADQLPSWGVTRQFDFGQFVILHNIIEVGGKKRTVPIVLVESDEFVLDGDVHEGSSILQRKCI